MMAMFFGIGKEHNQSNFASCKVEFFISTWRHDWEVSPVKLQDLQMKRNPCHSLPLEWQLPLEP